MARLLPGLIFLAASVNLPQCLHCFTGSRQVVPSNFSNYQYLTMDRKVEGKGFTNLNQRIPVLQWGFGRREHPKASWCGWEHSSPHIPG